MLEIGFGDVGNWICGGMLCWSKWVTCMVLKGGLNTYWECFSFLANVVRTYVIHLLGTYVTILCNWLIL